MRQMSKSKASANPFEQAAREWRQYRPAPSSELAFFLPLTPKGAVVLDAGCAHGRNHAKLLEKASLLYGVDLSPRLIEFAKQNALEKKFSDKTCFSVASITSLPLEKESVECVYCIAVLHHLKTPVQRKKALTEFFRVLRKGGRVFVAVWNRWQPRFAKLGRRKNALVPWKTKQGKIVQRFYHFFEKKELEKLARESGFAVEKIFWEKGGKEHEKHGAANLCAILRKKEVA